MAAAPRHEDATIAARFPDLRSARAAIEALEETGVDGHDITLRGVESPPRSARATGRVDRRIAGNLAGRTVRGAAFGALLGLAFGAILGAALIAQSSPDQPGQEVVVSMICGVGLFATLGAFIAFERSGTLSDAWPETFDAVPAGPLWVEAHTHDAFHRQRALRRLRRLQPLELCDFGAPT
jgi:hypothetical protein